MLAGIDISQYQTSTPSLTGLSFVILRASIGAIEDTMYDTHYANCRKAGVVTMAYHYGYPSSTAPIDAQAGVFLGQATNADFLWLDQEQTGFTDAQAQAFIEAIRAAGRPCGLYHSANGFGGVSADAKWVADWRSAASAANHPLKADGSAEFPGWDLWQWQGAPLDKDNLNPASPLADLLRTGYVTESAYRAQAALLQAQIDNLESDLALARSDLAHATTEIAELQGALAAASGIEKERIALARGAEEANRIRDI